MVQSPKRFCPNCGSPLEAGQRFCPNCGGALDLTSSPTHRPLNPEPTTSNVPTLPSAGGATVPADDATFISDTPSGPFAPTFVSNAPSTPSGVSQSQVPPPSLGQPVYEALTPPPPPEPYPPSSYPSSSNYPVSNANSGTFSGVNHSATTQAGPSQTPGSYAPVPDYARAPRRKPKTGLIAAVVALIIIIVAAVIVVPKLGGNKGNSSLTASQQTATYEATTSNVSTPTTAPEQTATPEETPTENATPTATETNSGSTDSVESGAKFTYSGVEIAVGKIEQSDKFNDDDSGSKPYTLRINVKEHNVITDTVYLYYNDILRLSLPNGSTVSPQKEGAASYIEQQVSRDTWYDFPLDEKQDVSKLVLTLGKNTDYQFTVPLSPNPDLSKYDAKSKDLTTNVRYAGLDWHIKKVTTQYYYGADQATSGHRYIVLDLSIDNTGSDTIYPFPNDNVRLKSATVTSKPSKSTLPSYFEGSSSGATGQLVFLMPDTDTSFQLNFLAQSNTKVAAASANINL